MKTIFGFGPLKVYLPVFDYTCILENCIQNIQFLKVNKRQQCIDGKIYLTNVKYRLHLDIQYSTCSEDNVLLLIYLIDIINNYKLYGDDLYIYPNYSDLNTSNTGYRCYIDSDIKLLNIAYSQTGQIINLSFIGRDAVYMPYITDGNTVYNIVDLSNNQYVDLSDNLYIMFV